MTSEMTTVNELLDEREARYGRFADHAHIAQGLKDVLADSGKWRKLNAAQRESLEMICHKIARILNGDPNYIDNWTDIAGYAVLVEQELRKWR